MWCYENTAGSISIRVWHGSHVSFVIMGFCYVVPFLYHHFVGTWFFHVDGKTGGFFFTLKTEDVGTYLHATLPDTSSEDAQHCWNLISHVWAVEGQ